MGVSGSSLSTMGERRGIGEGGGCWVGGSSTTTGSATNANGNLEAIFVAETDSDGIGGCAGGG